MAADPRTTVVVLTHNRAAELLHTLWRLTQLPEQPPVVVVDNGSTDGTAERVREAYAKAWLVRSERNLGAAGRNLGVDQVHTPYVAFCDDDTWWAPGALRRAADVLDAHPTVGALAARVLVGPQQREDPTCSAMVHSPLDATGLPGPGLIGFMAGAVVMRTQAYRAVGGYEPRLFIGGEERLFGLDLAARGWRMCYVPEVVTHHHPSQQRDAGGRRVLVARNELWIAWMRLPWRAAWQHTRQVVKQAAAQGLAVEVLLAALPGLPWALGHRRVVPPAVERMRQQVLGQPAQSRSEPRTAEA
ncbi:glycosyltransferase family 2 protein [Ideonella sp. BN130291]|uniref:glycosyltransferase family 2 protein n=1 Tax=Ideonella sp. BN130291 TaxID=3112940 RepID=UPI002E266959|nr:glycosyltransferase [Ideonella sp. BN130291]